MAGFKPVYEEDKELFMRLYRKYLETQFDKMEKNFKKLPTSVIERAFSGVEFFEDGYDTNRIEDSVWGFNGLCGYKKVHDVAMTMNYMMELMDDGAIVERLGNVGHKVNINKTGIRQRE